MLLLVVGAGASYAEAKHAGLPEELCPPLMKDFAERLWSEFNSHFLLSAYLREINLEPGNDACATFVALERDQPQNINVESFFEFAYRHRDFVAPGHEQFEPATEYENLLLHGIFNPLVNLLVQGLYKHGPETTQLTLAQTVARQLRPGDTVLNLNYDTIFEIGARRAGHDLVFLPNQPSKPSLSISKPHGSMNLLVDMNRQSFCFAEPLFVGSVQPSDGSRNYIGFVPPRLNKQYEQHPVAHAIIEATKNIEPNHVVFWGVGLTDSDTDLLELFRRWCQTSDRVDFINPSAAHVEQAKMRLCTDATRYDSVADWQSRLKFE